MSKDEDHLNLVGKKVVISLTGRVDSAVAAFLLKKQGMKVIGVAFSLSDMPEGLDPAYFPKCYLPDLEQVKEFCESINIPFYAVDAKVEFDYEVVESMVMSKMSGKANNTCYNCNKLRFKILYNKMKKLNADFIASGHFAKVYRNVKTDTYSINSNNDGVSDQSFLIPGLEKKIIKHLLLPLGELKKTDVEKIAKNFMLKVLPSSKREGFCYRNKEEYGDIVKSRIPAKLIKTGQVINIDNGNYHGEHEGIFNYSVGQNNLEFGGAAAPTDKALQICKYDFSNHGMLVGLPKNLTFQGTQLVRIQLTAGMDLQKPMTVFLKYKYSPEFFRADLYFKNNHTAQLDFKDDIYPLLPNESMILFERAGGNAKVLGFGHVGTRGEFKVLDRVSEFRRQDDDDETFKLTKQLSF